MKKESLFHLSLSIFLRMLLNGVLCLMIDFTVMPVISGRIGNTIVQLLCYLITCVLIFNFVWQKGNSDVNKVINDYLKEDSFRGMKAGFIAAIPAFITSVLLLLTKPGIISDIYVSIHALINPQFMSLILTLLPRTQTPAELNLLNIIIVSLLPLIFPLLCGFGYYLGYSRHSISEELIYQKG